MGVPKGYRKNVNIINEKIGFERRQEILDGITDKGTFLPKGVLEEDMDQTFVSFVKSEDGISISVDGVKIPVVFLTIQRWTEFTQTWKFADEYKNLEMPFITIVRKPDIQQGQNQAGLWNIPGNRTYTFMKVPTWDGVRRGIDLYKVPQPTSVDITYEVRLFTNRMKDLNRFNRKIQRAFQSRQCYINVNGHPMPLHLETIGDESNIDNFEKRRFYVQLFEMKLLGYILDEEDYELIPTINRTVMTVEVDEGKVLNKPAFGILKKGRELTWSFVWKPNSADEFTFIAQYDARITQLNGIENISRITMSINGNVVFDGDTLVNPIPISTDNIIMVKIYKITNLTGKFNLIGSTI